MSCCRASPSSGCAPTRRSSTRAPSAGSRPPRTSRARPRAAAAAAMTPSTLSGAARWARGKSAFRRHRGCSSTRWLSAPSRTARRRTSRAWPIEGDAVAAEARGGLLNFHRDRSFGDMGGKDDADDLCVGTNAKNRPDTPLASLWTGHACTPFMAADFGGRRAGPGGARRDPLLLYACGRRSAHSTTR
eukprot:7382241-Prymnesium_polylepis.3